VLENRLRWWLITNKIFNSFEAMQNISRKKFLRSFGAVLAGGTIAGISGVAINNSIHGLAIDANKAKSPANDGFVSPYRKIASFSVEGTIEAFEQYENKLYVSTVNAISVYDDYGKRLSQFSVKYGITRDIAVDREGVWLLRPTSVLLYAFDGELVREWEACSELSDYCSFALAGDFVFVTDRENKNMAKYTREGGFVQFIDSPNRFIIPSLTFGIEYANGLIYCSNSGRHQVEIYTLNGEYRGKFGSAGGGLGAFCGCCNPVHLTSTPTGEIITCEKGNPRVSCYGSDGKFRSLLLDSKILGGGYAAYEAKVAGNKIFAAGRDVVTIYSYDKQLAAVGDCAGCGIDCGLKRG
jgi:hypothetical protein